MGKLDKNALIDYIIKYKPKFEKKVLSEMSIEELVLIKVQIEIDLSKSKKE